MTNTMQRGMTGESSTPLARVMLAASIGSALEWYDFFVYGTAAALVFGQIFFPKYDPTTGTLAAFATFGIGFLVRPLGGLFFGHFGDRIGRKHILVITLLLVGGGTFLIGLLPTYAMIGVWAPILLTLMRMIQGFGAGAEYGGAVILAVEYAPPGRRGWFGSFAPMGVTVGNLLAAGVFYIVTMLLSKDQLLAWGWRIPFLVSFLLIAIGLYIRLKVSETPVFRDVISKAKALKLPVIEALRHPRNFLVVIGARMAENGLGYLFPVFGLSYCINTLHVERGVAITGVMLGNVAEIIGIMYFSALSDRIGRRPVYIGAALFGAAFAFPFFLMTNTRNPVLISLAFIIIAGVCLGGMFGPQAAYFAELFGPRNRYSGFAFARELGSVLAGGPSPLIAASLVVLMAGAPWYVAWYIILLALITVFAVWMGPETNQSDIEAEALPVQESSPTLTPRHA